MNLRAAIRINNQPLDQLDLVANDLYEWQPIEIACDPQPNVVAATLRMGDLDLGAPTTTLGDPVWRWRWNPQHAVGHFAAVLITTTADQITHATPFELRIVPRKLDVEQYEALIAAVQHDALALVFALSGGRAGMALQSPGGDSPRSLVEQYFTLVEGHIREAVAVAQAIGARPLPTLQTQTDRIELGAAERIDAADIADLLNQPLDNVPDDLLPALQTALRSPDQPRGGPLPRTVRATRSASTYDTIEHRVLRHVLVTLNWRLGVVREMIRREQTRRQRNAALIATDTDLIQSWFHRCNAAGRELRQALAQPWLHVGVLHRFPGPTHLMRRDPRYRRLHALYRDLRRVPFVAFDCATLWLPITELPLLYEQWCALQAVKAVLGAGVIAEQTLVARDDRSDGARDQTYWTLRLGHNAPLLTVTLPDQTRWTLYYQRRYAPQPADSAKLGALDPFVRVPDIALEITRSDHAPQTLIFDAKYRVAPDGGVPQDALDDAYAYRSAIGVAGARATLGAWLLFPGSQPLHTSDQVGALPLLPDQTAALDPVVRRIEDGR